jgi:CBS domain-containing protein
MTAGDCMSTPCLTVNADATLESCVELLEASLIRRLPVVDDYGECCGIISQADIARFEKQQAAELVHELST